MPMLTPSRIAIVVLSLSLFSFLWTLGVPYQNAQPVRPVIDHYDYKNVHSEPIIPAPFIAVPTPVGGHRWDDETRVGQTVLPGPVETGVEEYEDAGRWEDADRKKGEEKGSIAAAVPTTLITHVGPAPGDANATNATDKFSTPTDAPSNTHSSKFCKDVRGAPHVMVVVRTSKAEIAEKLPAHLKGLLSCVPNFAIFSDHSGQIEGIPVYNALEDIGGEAKRTHDEFHEYQKMHADGDHKPDAGKTKDLDKWKFLPMVYKAYKLRPAAKFVIFIEADTSLSWTNVLQWVNRLDYRIPYYSGSPIFIDSVQTAQRTSGIMLSQGALRRFVKSYDELYTSRWEEQVGKGCCGDLALARALGDAHVEFYSSWPLMQSEQPSTLDYTEKHWCAPAISWHHTSASMLESIWTVQTNWTAKHGWDKPYLYRDAFDSFVTPHLEAKKADWDNLSQDTKIIAPQGRQQQLKDEEDRSKKHNQDGADAAGVPPSMRSLFSHREDDKPKEIDWDKLAETFKDAADTPAHCAKACQDIEDCLQWRYKALGDGECHLGKVLRLGRRTTEKDEKWSSGWMVERVGKVVEGWACKEVKWKFYQ
ncbi:hypothetical protein CC86DRAFT_370973 [Ophiobolus disseminans]|uniref:Glycosyltransferase family 31 protein n=1 Tax=Ophiobolus disseminans TaxID=1469910 RepID=A0A6A6ZW34_9PLEO|nr:hypothetical protein CC86DRAFT_370973 [Ophiobolus disseminans]